jgi:hypothetical protein
LETGQQDANLSRNAASRKQNWRSSRVYFGFEIQS